MKPTPGTLLKGIALVLAAVAALAAANSLHRMARIDPLAAPLPAPLPNPLPGRLILDDPGRQGLRRCCTLTPEDVETGRAHVAWTLDTCWQARAAHRRRFPGAPADHRER